VDAKLDNNQGIQMELSGRDLEDLQRAAAVLQVSVDDLLQIRRDQGRKASAAEDILGLDDGDSGLGFSGSSSFSHQTQIVGGEWHGQRGQIGGSEYQGAQVYGVPSTWNFPQDGTSYMMDGTATTATAATTQYLGHIAADSSPVGDSSSVTVTWPVVEDKRVILLNARSQAPWYDCNVGLSNYWDPVELGHDDSSIQFQDVDSSEWVDATPAGEDMSIAGYTTISGHTASPKPGLADFKSPTPDDSSGDPMDWAIVPSSAQSTSSGIFQARSLSNSPSSKASKFLSIAPKPGRQEIASVPGNSSSRVKKKRAKYGASRKAQTKITRDAHACVRCRMQRNRVSWPRDP
jgi:hypothetical protein